MLMQAAIREATLNDVNILQKIMKTTFTDTFGVNYPPEELESFLSTAYSDSAIEKDLKNSTKITLLLEEDGLLLGYAMLHFESLPPLDLPASMNDLQTENVAEIQRFYFYKEVHGRGLAPLLMGRCLEVLKTRKYVWLGVWEENYRAIKFYEKFGFEKQGIKEFRVGSVIDRDYILTLLQ